ncbi:MAG: alpha-amylase [Bacteroidetes bacterium 41-46]|nr:MAG: alpha-amylase [Bacteroidetes bacterium 41-46]
MKKLIVSLLIVASIIPLSCRTAKKLIISEVEHPEWISDAVIYEVNTRQYTKEGTFNAFYDHLPRLKELGVEILWFMPIHPIGEKDRKGSLGSYYSIKDYKEVNPEFGNLDDFKRVVDKAHELGMKVILDWVANHTSRDAEWLKTNPEWYVMDSVTNSPVAPFDWSDVAKLDFNNKEMRASMLDAMKFWINEADIDGFRCDVASEVPIDFWESAVKEIKTIKRDILMLAEAEEPGLQKRAFNMYYGWRFHHIMNGIASGKYNADTIRAYYKRVHTRFPINTIAMHFTSNHDENSWNGTEFERLKDHSEQMAALTFILPGIPLIYNGQEIGFNRRLEFFKKDLIDWTGNEYFTDFYKSLIKLKKENTALSSLNFEGYRELETSSNSNIYAIERFAGDNIVIGIFNFNSESVEIRLKSIPKDLKFTDFKTGIERDLSESIIVEPYGYMIYFK